MRANLLISVAGTTLALGVACEKSAEAQAPNKASSEPVKSAGVPSQFVGTPAPNFKLTDQNGKEHDLGMYKGKIVVLEWTEEGCPFVRRHYAAGTMQKTAKKYEGKVVWLAVNSSHFVNPEKTQAWAKERGITYPVLLDAKGEAGRAYRAKTTPHMFIIGADGKVAYEGAIDDDPHGEKDDVVNFVDQALAALTSGQPVPVKATKPYGCSVKYGKAS